MFASKQLNRLIESLTKKKESELNFKVLKLRIDDFGNTVAHEMVKLGYVFTNEKVLALKNYNGNSVAHEMAKRGFIFIDEKVLRLKNYEGETVADYVVSFFLDNVNESSLTDYLKDEKVLSISNSEGTTIAHEIASTGRVPPALFPKSALKLANEEGWTVAHELVSHGFSIEDEDLLRLSKWDGITVAHLIARNGVKVADLVKNKEILKLADKQGWTVAHEAARSGWKFYDKDLLKTSTVEGRTVAHEMAGKGYVFEDKEILTLADKYGWTVAHEMAKNGHVFDDQEILKMADRNGWTVAHELASKGIDFSVNKEVLEMRTDAFHADYPNTTVAHLIAKNCSFNSRNLKQLLKEKETLKLKDESGNTVAYYLALRAYKVTNREILELINSFKFVYEVVDASTKSINELSKLLQPSLFLKEHKNEFLSSIFYEIANEKSHLTLNGNVSKRTSVRR